MVQLTTNLNKVKMEQEMASTKKSSIDLDSDDFLSGGSSVKTEIASLSSQVIAVSWIINHKINVQLDFAKLFEGIVDIMFSQVFTLKTTVFELSTDLTGVRALFSFSLFSFNFYNHININFATTVYRTNDVG